VTRRYEVVYLFDSALEEPAITERLTRFHALLGAETVVNVNHWGKRTLAYAIKRHATGYYVVAQFEVDPSVLPEFERAIKLDGGVVRFLVALMEEPVVVPAAVEPAVVGAEEDDG
jgi:small subunit ribosomal protein S6